MKEIVLSLLMTVIYIVMWQTAGFELAVCAGIGQIIAAITFNERRR